MGKKSIAVIKQLFVDGKIDDTLMEELKKDERKGVQHLIAKHEKEKLKLEKMAVKFTEMLHYEREAKANGYQFIAGVDEAGRGPLAGPVVAAAVILPADFTLLGLNDSKQLTEEQREYFFEIIKAKAVSYGIGIVSSGQIDELNILEATKVAMRQAIDDLNPLPDHVLIDAVNLSGLECASQALIKGDATSVSIAAASIIAKVTRDRLMKKIHKQYPMYDFHTNMGYGTKKHMETLKEYGASPYHRRSFAPVQKVLY